VGGDGTLLYSTSLTRRDIPIPPVLAIGAGSLGFLTTFDAATDVEALLDK
jgi:NAD kinase